MTDETTKLQERASITMTLPGLWEKRFQELIRQAREWCRIDDAFIAVVSDGVFWTLAAEFRQPDAPRPEMSMSDGSRQFVYITDYGVFIIKTFGPTSTMRDDEVRLEFVPKR